MPTTSMSMGWRTVLLQLLAALYFLLLQHGRQPTKALLATILRWSAERSSELIR
jgi:hypothetical protein